LIEKFLVIFHFITTIKKKKNQTDKQTNKEKENFKNKPIRGLT